MKNWKRGEKKITEWYSDLGPEATRTSRYFRGEAVEDVEWGKFSIEIKTRKKIPQYIHDWMAQAEANARDKIGVVHWHQDHQRLDNDLIIMRACYFRYFMSLLMEAQCDSE